MINILNGNVTPENEITWAENKASATVILNTHSWKPGETMVVGYNSKGGGREIIIGLGVGEGFGPSYYRVVIDKSVLVVTEILESAPDVSYYVFNQRYLVRGEDGELYFTRRYFDQDTGETTVEKIKAGDKCIIVEAATGDIWVCSPPDLINLYSLSSQNTFGNATDMGDGTPKIDITSNGRTWRNLCFITSDEREYLNSQAFDKNFSVSVSGQQYDSSGSPVSGDPCKVSRAVYTLSVRYKGNPVDLDEVPGGWTKVKVGVYTKTVPGNRSSSSGSVVCKLTVDGHTGTKTHGGASLGVYSYMFILYSPTPLTIIDRADYVFTGYGPGLGMRTLTPPQDSYIWFAFPKSFSKPKITQLGVNYIYKDPIVIEGVIKDGVNLGDYIVYRSLNPGNGESQDINIG